jgi:hypothetical protein
VVQSLVCIAVLVWTRRVPQLPSFPLSIQVKPRLAFLSVQYSFRNVFFGFFQLLPGIVEFLYCATNALWGASQVRQTQER